MIIYLDESGDLGFDFNKSKTTRKFVISLLVCNETEAVHSFTLATRRTLKNKLNFKKNSTRELKGTQTSLPVKKYFYRHLSPQGWQIHTLVLDKNKALQLMKNQPDKNRIYNVLAHDVIRSIDFTLTDSVTLINDRCKSSSEIRIFNDYIQNQLEATLPLNVPLYIHHNLSHDEPGLQAVDLFSWGIFRKYEFEDMEWYEEFNDKIAYELEYYEKAGKKKDGP